MFMRLFLLFTIVPSIELAVLIYAGSLIGVFNALAIVITTAFLGAIMVRHEGLNVMYSFRASLQNGEFPSDALMDGAMILAAGALLLTPGFFTDIFGLLLVFPASRAIIKKTLIQYLKKNFSFIPPRPPGPY